LKKTIIKIRKKVIRKGITDFETYKKNFEEVLNSAKFIEGEENKIKKLAAPKKPKTEAEKEKEKEREARKKAYLERKALQLEENKKKAEEDRM